MKTIIVIFSFLYLINSSHNDLVTKKGAVWMTENLSVSTFNNGDEILHAKTDKEWQAAFKDQIPAFCYYNNDAKNNESYGKLYNFYAVNDERGLAPDGWHVATDIEWESMINELGGLKKAGAQLKKNDFKFSPGGFRDNNGSFFDEGNSALFWTATIDFSFLSFNRQISVDDKTPITRGSSHHAMGMYVRCVKN